MTDTLRVILEVGHGDAGQPAMDHAWNVVPREIAMSDVERQDRR